MNVTQGMSDTTQFPLLERLPFDFTEKDLSVWLDTVNTLGFGYQRILKLPSEMFWSSAIYNHSLLASFDSALDSIPKAHEVKLFKAIYCWNEEARKSVERLRAAVLGLYCRIAVYSKNLDPELTSKQWVEYTSARGLMPWSRAAAVWAHFPEKTDLFSKIVSFSSRFVLNPAREVATLADKIKKACSELESSSANLQDTFHLAKGSRKLRSAHLVVDLLHLVIDTVYSIHTLLEVLSGAKMTASTADFISGIPPLVEAVARFFPIEILLDVAMTLPSYPLRTVLALSALIEQGGAVVFHKALQVMPSALERFTLVQGALTNERFIFFANEHSPLLASLPSCEPDQRRYIEHAVEGIILIQTAEAKKRLERQGLLERIGEIDRLPVEQRSAIDSLNDVLAHLPTDYVHLCLRHFNYDVALATEALLFRDGRLSMDLRRVETADLRSNDMPVNLPTLSFEEEDLLQSTVRTPSAAAPTLPSKVSPAEDTRKNVFKGLFSLAPPVAKPQESGQTTGAVGDPSVVMKKLRSALDRVKLRAEGRDPDFEVQEGPNGERLVPMKEAKMYGIERFKTSTADKVAIRPTYEKFRYETAFEDEDMYDDEYDDGYEQKEFRIEPLNGRLSEDEEDEPDAGSSDPNQEKPPQQANERQQQFVRGGGVPRGGPRGQRGGGGRGGARGGKAPQTAPAAPEQANGERGGQGEQRGGASRTDYTGGRQRQVKERHKNEYKQRGADRKMRAAFRGGM